MGGELGQVARGLPAPADASDRFFADLLAGFLHHMDGEVAAGADLLATAVADAERTGDPTLAIPAHQAFYVGDDAAALRLNARAVARARATGAVADLLFALPRLVQAEVLAGQWTAATAGAAEAVQLAEEVPHADVGDHPVGPGDTGVGGRTTRVGGRPARRPNERLRRRCGISLEGLGGGNPWLRLPFQAAYIAWVLWTVPDLLEPARAAVRRLQGARAPAAKGSG